MAPIVYRKWASLIWSIVVWWKCLFCFQQYPGFTALLLWLDPFSSVTSEMQGNEVSAKYQFSPSFLWEREFQLTSALFGYCLAYSTIILTWLFASKAGLKAWMWNWHFAYLKKEELNLLLRRVRKSEAEIVPLGQSFVFVGEEIVANALGCVWYVTLECMQYA